VPQAYQKCEATTRGSPQSSFTRLDLMTNSILRRSQPGGAWTAN
jgi:hypothetical protein